ncbi:MAG TPA: cell division protein ZapE [Rhizomicrobium sp.]|nr:cell division protein ZapE [Rhizomicrobium sp.]
MPERIVQRYRTLVASKELTPDAAQEEAVTRLQALEAELRSYRPARRMFFGANHSPKGLYLWGGVGRGKSMLMDLFFSRVPLRAKRRVHFNAFMTETHARIHGERQGGANDPISPVARRIAQEATLLCFDEFQVTDIADAMILGRLFEQLFAAGVIVVATSNTAPQRLYEGGLNRQLFLPFIALLEHKLEILELNGPIDYRLQRLTRVNTYIVPLGAAADAKMDTAWFQLTGTAQGDPRTLIVLGRRLRVPQTAKGAARFSFDDLCRQALTAADYLEIAHRFHTLLIDRTPVLSPAERNEARRLTLLIDTLYDEHVKLICSAAAPPDELYPQGDGADAFRRTASRLSEMRSVDYLKHGHAVRRGPVESPLAQA